MTEVQIFEPGGDTISAVWMPDVIRPIVSAAADSLQFPVYFDYGHYQEVARNLTFKDSSNDVDGNGYEKDKKYPLVWLIMDTEERVRKDSYESYAELRLNLLIAMPTNPAYTMDERRDLVFMPVLYPIYEQLMYHFSRSEDFGMPSIYQIEHTKIDRPFWGGIGANGNTKSNLWNDFIDAVQIQNLILNLKRSC